MAFPPHTFSNQSGNVPAQELDDNFSACQPALGFVPVNRSGDTMTGPLLLSGDATAPLQATTLEQLNTSIALRGYIDGLILSTAGSSSVFGISAGIATATNASTVLSLAAAYTKTTGAWLVGSGNGSLDTGTIANTTGYHVYMIGRIDTGVTDVLISQAPGTSSTVTISVGTPAIVTWANHGLEVGAPFIPTTTGALPTGLTAGTRYFVSAVGSTNTFSIAATQGGSAINTTGTQSGVQTGTSTPLLPTNYNRYRRIMWLKTDSSAHWLAFIQYGNQAVWTVSINDFNSSLVAATATLIPLTVPLGVKVLANFSANSTATVGPNKVNVWISSPDTADATTGDASTAGPLTQAGGVTTGAYCAALYPTLRTDQSGQIRAKAPQAQFFFSIQTYGWTDPRGTNN